MKVTVNLETVLRTVKALDVISLLNVVEYLISYKWLFVLPGVERVLECQFFAMIGDLACLTEPGRPVNFPTLGNIIPIPDPFSPPTTASLRSGRRIRESYQLMYSQPLLSDHH